MDKLMSDALKVKSRTTERIKKVIKAQRKVAKGNISRLVLYFLAAVIRKMWLATDSCCQLHNQCQCFSTVNRNHVKRTLKPSPNS